MYKVAIADDEKIIQEGLSESIDWEELGFQVVGCFSDGSDLIEYLDTMPVDVVITDIMMNRAGGIEVAQHIQQESLPCKVIFISGHSDFELAHKAIKYGVMEYMLKPIQLDEVTAVLQRIKDELDKSANDVAFRSKQQEHRSKLQLFMKEQFINNLTLGAFDNRIEIEERLQFLMPDCHAELSPCMLMDVQITDIDQTVEEQWDASQEQFYEELYRFIDEYQSTGLLHILFRDREKLRLFMILRASCEELDAAQSLCDAAASQLGSELSQSLKTSVTVSVKRVFRNIFKVAEMRELLLTGNSEFYDKDILLQEQKKLIVSNILLGNFTVSQKVMLGMVKSLSLGDMRYCRNVVVDIFACINEALRENDPQLYRLVRPYIDYHIIVNFQSIAEIERYCLRLFGRMKDREGRKDQFDSGALVNHMKQYVRSHIFEDILVDDIAEEVFFSVSHLRRVFKKETGETFLQYVVRKKMEKAVELLHDPKYRIYQISDMLGYKSSRYFSKLFYSNIGCFPGEYRKDVLHMREVPNEE